MPVHNSVYAHRCFQDRASGSHWKDYGPAVRSSRNRASSRANKRQTGVCGVNKNLLILGAGQHGMVKAGARILAGTKVDSGQVSDSAQAEDALTGCLHRQGSGAVG